VPFTPIIGFRHSAVCSSASWSGGKATKKIIIK
jgi:hypothetical protein